MRYFCKIFILICLFLLISLPGMHSLAKNLTNQQAILIPIQGTIGPTEQDFFHRNLKLAIQKKAKVIILQMDTPGGLNNSMRGIVQDILSSSIPVISYVSPSGARAASAGTYILYASHLAAMAPGTNIGAASPVNLLESSAAKANEDKKQNKSVEELKVVNDAQAYIRSLAQLRHRNGEWAEQSITQSSSLSANEALRSQVIDFIAYNTEDLLTKADGRTVLIENQNQQLHTKDLAIYSVHPDWKTKLLSVITNPSVAYILLMIGFYGLFFEFMSPGYVLPGVAGAIALLLALYSFQLLPIDYAGLGLIIFGITLIAMEPFLPSGVLAVGGLISFVLGSVMLLNKNQTGITIPTHLILLVTFISVIFFLGLLQLVLRAHKRPIVSGREALVGMIGVVEAENNIFWIRVEGERWQIIGKQPLIPGQRVKIVAVKGLKLQVEPWDSV